MTTYRAETDSPFGLPSATRSHLAAKHPSLLRRQPIGTSPLRRGSVVLFRPYYYRDIWRYRQAGASNVNCFSSFPGGRFGAISL